MWEICMEMGKKVRMDQAQSESVYYVGAFSGHVSSC